MSGETGPMDGVQEEANTPDYYTRIAREHGRDEGPETEAGDLQVFFSVSFGMLTEDQKRAFAGNPAVRETIEAIPMPVL